MYEEKTIDKLYNQVLISHRHQTPYPIQLLTPPPSPSHLHVNSLALNFQLSQNSFLNHHKNLLPLSNSNTLIPDATPFSQILIPYFPTVDTNLSYYTTKEYFLPQEASATFTNFSSCNNTSFSFNKFPDELSTDNYNDHFYNEADCVNKNLVNILTQSIIPAATDIIIEDQYSNSGAGNSICTETFNPQENLICSKPVQVSFNKNPLNRASKNVPVRDNGIKPNDHDREIFHRLTVSRMTTPKKSLVAKKVIEEYICNYPGCLKVFEKKYNMKSHLVSHVNSKPFSCENCNKKYKRKHDMARHKKEHEIDNTGKNNKKLSK
ncbi:hypothetical protein HDU92_007137 [Lobulomyces angularis]|nr:hypothetical protein HDU92_007137 [Lobulomyces angularis]